MGKTKRDHGLRGFAQIKTATKARRNKIKGSDLILWTLINTDEHCFGGIVHNDKLCYVVIETRVVWVFVVKNGTISPCAAAI